MKNKTFEITNGCTTCGHKLCAKKVPLFNRMSPDQLELIVKLIQRKHYKKGEYLLQQEEKFDVLYIVNSGRIKASHFTIEGREQILNIINEGDSIGELALLKEGKAPYDLIAMKDSNICTIPKVEFDALIIEHPQIMLSILSSAHDRIVSLEEHISAVTSNDADVRLKFLLNTLSHGLNKEEQSEFTLDISREDMASFVGVSRETISRKLSKLVKTNIIEMVNRNTIRILDTAYFDH